MSCDVCGPLTNGDLHSLCHPIVGRHGCGHLLKDHADGLKCRICKAECGVYCRPDLDPMPARQRRLELGDVA